MAASLDDVRRTALSLEFAEESTSWGNAAWRVGGRLFVWERPLRKADRAALGGAASTGDVVAVRVEHEGAKLALLQDASGAYFTTPHFDGHPIVLVYLARVDPGELAELITEAWSIFAERP